ncbi:MAG: cell division protein [Rhodospirillales bacterium]|nr:cell division protein [Rhodospirillales bacterium]
MLGRHSDLPLKGDATSRFLPWLVALMVFLAAVAVAAVLVIHAMIERWDRDVSGTLTVQITPAAARTEAAEAVTLERVAAAEKLLRETPGILSTRALERKQLVSLLEPWLGNAEILQGLPLPRLIDVTVAPGIRLDLDALSKSLSQAVPGASLDDHRVWLSRLIGLSRSIQWLALGALSMIGAITSLTVVYATLTGLAVHRPVIEVLHLIGATDTYIAGQFAARALSLGLKGGAAGLALAAPCLLAVGWAARRVEGGFVPSLSLSPAGWAMVALIPVMAALLAMLTARFTVLAALKRMP